jgi:hypothetical protein
VLAQRQFDAAFDTQASRLQFGEGLWRHGRLRIMALIGVAC